MFNDLKYTGRILGLLVMGMSSMLWMMYGDIGGHPFIFFVAAIIPYILSWWLGRKYDQMKYHLQQLQKSESETNKLLESKTQQTNKLLMGSQQRFTSLFVHNTEAILVFDLEGNVVDGNPVVEKMCGYSPEELKRFGMNLLVLPEDMEKRLTYYTKAFRGEPQEYGLFITHKNGKRLEMQMKMIPITLGNEVVGVFELLKDMTESRKLEEFIRHSEKLSLVGQLAAGIAHEIRNPLTTIRGFLQLWESKMGKQYTEIVLAEIDRINLIVGEFLMLAKPQKSIFKEKDLKNILSSVVMFLEGQANIKNIQIITHAVHHIPNVKCEENQLKQVFINLLKNAMEAMPNGGKIYVELEVFDENEVCVFIRDEGCGIPQAQLHRIGDPFYSTKEEGTGLGLMVSHKIIENHGGYITLDSEIGKGTAVGVVLPTH